MPQSTILILGAGQVGLEVARQRLWRGSAEKIIIHCLTKKEAEDAVAKLTKECRRFSPIDIQPSWGNVFYPSPIARFRNIGPKNERKLLKYFYGELSEELVRGSFLYSLIKKYKPDIIVDAINTATAIGYHQDFYDQVREFLSGDGADFGSFARSLPIPQIIRFVQILKASMDEFSVRRYIKVSTTGLGGMGFNIKYTHGDLGEPGLSTKLLGKVSAAGILHQLLWTLRHTPGFSVNLIVPAALIGWGEIKTKEIDLSKIRVFTARTRDLVEDSVVSEASVLRGGVHDKIKFPVVESGENGDYGWFDMAAITAPGQMGAVTKEEVAYGVIRAMYGDEKNCVLAAMDAAQMSDSKEGYLARSRLMKDLEAKNVGTVKSASFMNLGPKIAKFLWELTIISNSMNFGLKDLVANGPTVGCGLANNRLIYYIKPILSLGLPVITEREVFVPEQHKDKTFKELRGMADNECVDLRVERMEFWHDVFRRVIKVVETRRSSSFSNVDAIESSLYGGQFHPGELLAFWFTISGGEKVRS